MSGRSDVGERFTVFDAAAFAVSVTLILIYAHVWFALATGYGAKTAEAFNFIFYAAYGLATALLLTRPGPTLVVLARSPLLLMLVGLCAASVVWSIAPDITVRRVVALMFTTFAGVALGVRWSWPRLAEVLAVSFALMALASLFLGAVLPSLGRMTEIFPGAWRGLWIEKNSLGGMMALGCLIHLAAAALAPRRRLLWLAMAGLSAGLVLLSTSKTSLVVLLLGLTAVAFMSFVKAGPIRSIFGTWIAVVGVTLAATLVLTDSALVLEALGKDGTLTGRTKIWEGILRQTPSVPWTGFGFGAIWDNPDRSGPAQHVAREAHFLPAHAHNGWLEVLIAIGLPGVILFAIWLAQMWGATILALYRNRSAWLLLPFMIVYTVMMLTESITLNWHDIWWILFVALAARAVRSEPAAAPAAVRRQPPSRIGVRGGMPRRTLATSPARQRGARAAFRPLIV